MWPGDDAGDDFSELVAVARNEDGSMEVMWRRPDLPLDDLENEE